MLFRSVEKSCIANRFAFNKFSPINEPTFLTDYITKSFKKPDTSTVIEFKIWDTAGQEKYRSMASSYYRDASAAIIVYDLTNKSSFNGAKSWIKELGKFCKNNILIVLVGNKSDLIGMFRLNIK